MRMIQVILSIVLVIGLYVPAQGEDDHEWSPNRELYAVSEPGQQVGKGLERQRLVVYTKAGARVGIAHVWDVEPDGTPRVGIRGCESWGWLDNSRLFCEGSINPSTGIYLVFDARSGRELGEFAGGPFVWSPDQSHIASYGNVPHFSAPEGKSDSLEIDGKCLYPREGDHERHWFHSELTWSPDSRKVAVTDNRQTDGSLWLVVVSVDGQTVQRKLPWVLPGTEWPPVHDVSLQWEKGAIIVEYNSQQHRVSLQGGQKR
jgi:hypothetical protein